MEKTTPISVLRSSVPLLDVRSPKEYQSGHIPGAQKLPLFTDEERAKVGTCYKQQGQQAAIKLGLDLVGPKMSGFIEQAEIHGTKQLNLYCWRGGMRSESMAWLLSRYGFEVQVITGGYKAYRQEMMRYFESPLPLRILTGNTGSAKTLVLQAMANQGSQVVDLEALANHQGSSFGNQLSDRQPTSEQFQNDLFAAFISLDSERPIWLEDESICIGRVSLPDALFAQMSTAKHYQLLMPNRRRLDLLLSDYGRLPIERLREATQAISKKLGHSETVSALEHLDDGDLRSAAEIILTYYDRQYRKSVEKKQHLIAAEITGGNREIEEIAKELIAKECQSS